MPATQFTIPYPVVAKPTNVGAPGARAYFYAPGTTTLVPIYASSALTTLLTNPVIADGAGRFPDIYLVTGTTYKLVLTDKNGAVLYNQDPYIPGIIVSNPAENPNYTYVVQTLAAGSSATLTATGTYPDITLTFGLPRGNDGSGASLGDGDYGDIIVSASGAAMTIDQNAVTYAKFQDASAGNVVLARAATTTGDYSEVALAASNLLGRGTTGNVTAITLGTGLSMSGQTLNATVSGDPWTYYKRSSDFNGTSTSFESSGLTAGSLLANTYYEFEATFEAHVSSGSFNLALVWPSNVTGAAVIQTVNGTTISSVGGSSGATLTTANINSTTPVPVRVMGYAFSGATVPTGSLDIQIKTTSGSATHTVGQGGFLKIRSI